MDTLEEKVGGNEDNDEVNNNHYYHCARNTVLVSFNIFKLNW